MFTWYSICNNSLICEKIISMVIPINTFTAMPIICFFCRHFSPYHASYWRLMHECACTHTHRVSNTSSLWVFRLLLQCRWGLHPSRSVCWYRHRLCDVPEAWRSRPLMYLYLRQNMSTQVLNTLRMGLLNCLNAHSRGLTFRHRASCI